MIIGIGLKCMFNVHRPTFQGQPIEKNGPIILMDWVLRRVEKKMKKE